MHSVKRKTVLILTPALIVIAALAYLYFYQATPLNDPQNRNAAKDDPNKPKVFCDYSATGKVVINSAKDNQGCLYLGCGAFF